MAKINWMKIDWMKIDWTKPLEDERGRPCSVISGPDRDGDYRVSHADGVVVYHGPDGTCHGLYYRNIRNAALAITLPAGWVAHAPHLAERTADRAIVVIGAETEENLPPWARTQLYARSATPGAGRFGVFADLRAAVEFYDKQWPARPAGWTWRAEDVNHGPHWRRDADGFRVTETLGQWRGVTPDGYMTTGYFKTAEAVMAFAEQTRPAK